MWSEAKNETRTVTSNWNESKMVDPDLLAGQALHTVLLRNGTTAASTRPSCTEDSLKNSGIIPGAIAATVFIVFLLVLYAVLWKCMVSPPRRKHRTLRTRQKTSV